ALDAGMVEAHINAASVYVKLGKLDDAEQHALTAIARQPRQPLAHSSLGTVRLYQHRDDEAETSLRRALELNPDDVYAHYSLGFVHAHRRDWEAAITELEKALALRPTIVSDVLILEPQYAAQGPKSERVDAFFAHLHGR